MAAANPTVLPSRVKGLTGRRFTRLTVLRYAGRGDAPGAFWECRCDCGKVLVVKASMLKRGQKTSCGCRRRELARMKKYRNHAGQRFGMWTALSYVRTDWAGSRKQAALVVWLCRCDCGREREVLIGDLKQGKSRSCGCTFNRDINLVGRRFGRLLVISLAQSFRHGARAWLCKCDCGEETVTTTCYLLSGDTISCGCRKRGVAAERCRTHGESGRGSKTPEYRAWCAMIDRCENDNRSQWDDYGGRGITVCERWRNSFAAFLQDMGRRTSAKHSIDRIDNDGNYEPGNCRWATRKVQNNNQRGHRRFAFNGLLLTSAGWADRLGVRYYTFQARLEHGWTIEEAVTTPFRASSRT